MPMTLITGLMALAFCTVHLFVGKLRFLERTPRSKWLSFAGGVAVGYVFLHILPELGAHATTFGRETPLAAVVAESWVYTLSLAGLVLFYGLERALAVSRDERMTSEGRDRPHRGIFWVHIGASGLLMLMIAYLLNHREDSGTAGLVLYFAAMMLHFVTADFGTRSDHPELYDRRGRWILAVATLGGWALGLLVNLPEIVIACLFAFVAGGIVLLVLKEELPEERKSYFLPFLGGVALYAVLVLGEIHLVAT
jgi:zinc transporter ZupT